MARHSVQNDIFDFSEYERWRANHNVTAVRLHVSAPSEQFGLSISYRQTAIAPHEIIEVAPRSDTAELGLT